MHTSRIATATHPNSSCLLRISRRPCRVTGKRGKVQARLGFTPGLTTLPAARRRSEAIRQGSGRQRVLTIWERMGRDHRQPQFRDRRQQEPGSSPGARASQVWASYRDRVDARRSARPGEAGRRRRRLPLPRGRGWRWNGLGPVNEHPSVPVTVLPAGTKTAAQHFGLRRNPTWLARTIAAGEVHRADVGRLGDRRFLLMAGFGFDGDVVTRHHRSRTTRSGRVKPTHRAAYVEPILRSSLFYRFPPISVVIEDHGREEILRGRTVFVFNLPGMRRAAFCTPGASG